MTLVTLKSQGIVDLRRLKSRHIRIEDIVDGLVEQTRFSGQGSRVCSVAEHSAAISRWLVRQGYPKSTQRLGLAHDFHEYLLSDMTSGMKELIGREQIRRVESYLDSAIFEAFSLTPTDEERRIVKAADRLACATEYQQLFGAPIAAGAITDDDILWVTADRGREAFMSEFERLFLAQDAYQ